MHMNIFKLRRIFLKIFFQRIYLFERKRGHKHGGGAEGEGDTDSAE